MTQDSPIARYRATALEASQPVIRRYSSSFSLATALFPRRCRQPISAIYALVRVADEIVDGTAADAGLSLEAQREILDEFEADTERAMSTGFSANLVVQAFADVARATGIGTELTRPFFSSMRRDLDPVGFDEESLREYVYGSAEVVGLMCLRVFQHGQPAPADPKRVEAAACALGSAFQMVNFLRDLADDRERLDRRYLPGLGEKPDADVKNRIVSEITADLQTARAGIGDLPSDCRHAVATATALFGDLLTRIDATPAETLMTTRISVPTSRKLALALRERLALAGRAR
ncbi:phytoene/squalene synthase family protein [Salinibacterium sp. ZJ77]|uniref:phytoene/squalene synthase family protein n=1 Tax=Salinibacterium sp. ZJ77 TaxID=2708337 RepID=UPI00141DF16F|nr:phytoene/squalene synthase family protein [Salinibacterium sp. ZJ77]